MTRRIGGPRPDVLIGDDEDDELHGKGGGDLIRGKGGDDRLWGNAGKDEIYGGDGRDRIFGGGGFDFIRGGANRDTIAGGGGRDDIGGGGGGDIIGGGKGKDTLRGGNGADVLVGGDGEDTIAGDDGADRIRGNDGADELGGGAGDDIIWGGDGADQLFGDAGNNQLTGDAGADWFALSPDLPGDSTVVDFDYDEGDRILLDFDRDADRRLDASEYGAWRAAMQAVTISVDDGNTIFSLAASTSGALASAATDEAIVRLAGTSLGGSMADLAIHDYGLNPDQEETVPTNPSRSSNDTEATRSPASNANGRLIAVVSLSNLDDDQGDIEGTSDIFVFDRLLGRVIRVNTTESGDLARNDGSDDVTGASVSISADGRFVAFSSNANNLGELTTSDDQDHVFVKDLLTGNVFPASVGIGAGNRLPLDSLSISGDGQIVAFVSDGDAYVSQVGGSVTRIEALAGVSHISLAADGSRAVLAQDDRLLVSDMGNSSPTTRLLSTGRDPNLSSDGRFVVYEDGNQVLRRDIDGDDVVVVGVVPDNDQGGPSISAEGRFVAFASEQDDLVPNDTNGLTDVFVKDLLTGAVARVNIDAREQQAFAAPDSTFGGDSFEPSISADGRFVAYTTLSPNLQDLYVDQPTAGSDLDNGRTVVWSPVDFERIALPDLHGNEQTDAVLYVGGEVESNIAAFGDVDFIRFSAEADVLYEFAVTANPVGPSNVDLPFVQLEPRGGLQPGEAGDADGGTVRRWSNDDVTLFVTARSTLFIHGDNDMFVGDYRITLDVVDVPANSGSEAILTVGDAIEQTIDRPGDRDWYSVTLEPGTQYRFKLRGEDTHAGSLENPRLELFDDEGSPVRAGQDDVAPGTNRDSFLDFTAGAESYFVSAEASDSGTGTYTLSVAEIFEQPITAGAPPVITSPPLIDPGTLLTQAQPNEAPPSA